MKLTSEIALNMITDIELLLEQIEEIYARARTFDGINNDSVIKDAIEARRAQREAADDADMLIRSFDAEDEPDYRAAQPTGESR